MSDKNELADYKGLDRPEYILRNGKALNIYGAKKILKSQQADIEKLTEENKRLREALIEIESLPEVRMDESSFIARKAIGFKQ